MKHLFSHFINIVFHEENWRILKNINQLRSETCETSKKKGFLQTFLNNKNIRIQVKKEEVEKKYQQIWAKSKEQQQQQMLYKIQYNFYLLSWMKMCVSDTNISPHLTHVRLRFNVFSLYINFFFYSSMLYLW